MNISDLIERDMACHWHPCSQMKDYETFQPLVISQAKGCRLKSPRGEEWIDGISSWWCKSLGHQHPRLKKALIEQWDQFDHVISANTTSESIVLLSEKLTTLLPRLKKVLYSSDGSCAVEIALKMSLHARLIQGKLERCHFISLSNSYHGETLGALSVSDSGYFRNPYQSLLFKDCTFLTGIPYVSGREDPLWKDCSAYWASIEAQLELLADKTTAILVEPIVQGAGGMKIYSQDFLKRISIFARNHGIHLIADEILTGVGRTGPFLACSHAEVQPDFLCLGKGLTSGVLPLSAVVVSNEIYEMFYRDYDPIKSFLHSHTHSGNALAVRVALETLRIIEEEKILEKIPPLETHMRSCFEEISETTQRLKNLRGVGGMMAAEINLKSPRLRAGFEFAWRAARKGAFLRPIGDILYWLPPFIIQKEEVNSLKRITQEVLQEMDP